MSSADLAGPDTAVRLVTAIVGVVVGLTFLFAFGNVATLGIRLWVPTYVAFLVAPAVDLSVVALLVGTRHLVLLWPPSWKPEVRRSYIAHAARPCRDAHSAGAWQVEGVEDRAHSCAKCAGDASCGHSLSPDRVMCDDGGRWCGARGLPKG
jgi:hypothetical protein